MSGFLLLPLQIAAAQASPGRTGSVLDIKIASVAPSNSPYSTALEKLASSWETISGGRIRVRVYENGVAGNQADMLRKMRIGQIQGGLFASPELSGIVPAALAVSVPYLISSDAELAYTMNDLRPVLDSEAASHGYKSVVWAEAGWAYLFSTSPVATPAEAKKLKFAVPSEEPALIETFKTLGYRTISIDLPETLSSLNSGLANAVFATPSLAAGYQWFGIAKYMINVKIAPALGTVLINGNTWNRIPAELRPRLESAAQEAERDLQSGLEQADADAVRIMQEYGLKLVEVSEHDKELWKAELDRHWDQLVGPVFEPAAVDLIRSDLAKYRGEYRGGGSESGTPRN